MDAKITLSFDRSVIERAKSFADDNNISLSRLTEFLLSKVVHSSYKSLDELPVSDWITQISEGTVDYIRNPRSRKGMKEEYYSRKKQK